MGIVIDLQKEALAKDADILSLLRKAYLVARKLKLNDFEELVRHELNGYNTEDKLPDYRIYKGEVKAWNPYHGWIPVIFDRPNHLRVYYAREPIANLIDVYHNCKNHIATVPFNENVNAVLSEQNPFPTKYCLQIPVNLLFTTFEALRNAILDWALTLEENGIIGEELNFSLEEIQTAAKTSVINNYTNNFFGNAGGTQIQQGSHGNLENN